MIHKFSLFGTNIVLDVNSGSVHVVDDITYDILDHYNCNHTAHSDIVEKLSSKYSRFDILESIEEIQKLKESNLLFSFNSIQDLATHATHKHAIKAMCLHISHDCNLRCKYCFASGGSFGGKRVNMDLNVGFKAVDFLINQSGDRVNLEIDFFGGEPLLNFDVVKQIVNYARSMETKFSKKFKFTITTNAILLDDDTISYINENMDNVVLSIDGRQHTNDYMRVQLDGSGSYSNILPKIKKLVSMRTKKDYYVRGTYTKQNLDFSADVLHLADLGFKQISIEPMVAKKDYSKYALTEDDLPFLFNQYEILARRYVEINKDSFKFNFFHFMLDLDNFPCLSKRIRGCGSGFEYVAVDPNGNIYPCHQFVGIPDFLLGTVFCKTLNSNIQNTFRDSNINTKKECSNCWAKFFCSGGCAANAYTCNNDINIPSKISCELQKKRIECALWVNAVKTLHL